MSNQEMSQWDKHQLMRTLLREQPQLTNAEISRRTGYSASWVSDVRRDVESEPERKRRYLLNRAAPDMLEALILVRNTLDNVVMPLKATNAANAIFGDQIRAAIAKATGENE